MDDLPWLARRMRPGAVDVGSHVLDVRHSVAVHVALLGAVRGGVPAAGVVGVRVLRVGNPISVAVDAELLRAVRVKRRLVQQVGDSVPVAVLRGLLRVARAALLPAQRIVRSWILTVRHPIGIRITILDAGLLPASRVVGRSILGVGPAVTIAVDARGVVAGVVVRSWILAVRNSVAVGVLPVGTIPWAVEGRARQLWAGRVVRGRVHIVGYPVAVGVLKRGLEGPVVNLQRLVVRMPLHPLVALTMNTLRTEAVRTVEVVWVLVLAVGRPVPVGVPVSGAALLVAHRVVGGGVRDVRHPVAVAVDAGLLPAERVERCGILAIWNSITIGVLVAVVATL
mmetsp:Transcript_21656/g.56523  ORF Transcript_21656/g.56523 Transcript_21656/m.56523 type:complete len:339 (-) Transcript_21656:442-1458(-)